MALRRRGSARRTGISSASWPTPRRAPPTSASRSPRATGRTVIPLALKAHPNAIGIANIVPAIPTSIFVDAFENLLITAPNVVGLVRGDGTVPFRTRGPVGERIDLDALAGGRPASEAPRVGIFEHPHPRSGSAVLTAYARLPPPARSTATRGR